jgi:hypothetical protein
MAMGMKITWRETGPRRMEIRERPAWAARLAGIPFLVVPLLLFGTATDAWVIRFLFALVFFVVGWMVVFRARTVRVYGGDRHIEEVVSHVLWRTTRTVRTDAVVAVVTERHTVVVRQKRGTRTVRTMQVRLMNGAGEGLLRFGFGHDAEQARALGRDLARMLDCRWDDRTADSAVA